MKTYTTITTTKEQRAIVVSSIREMSAYNPALAPLIDEIEALEDHQFHTFLTSLGRAKRSLALLVEHRHDDRYTSEAWEYHQHNFAVGVTGALARALRR